jgi:hypothetical protein
MWSEGKEMGCENEIPDLGSFKMVCLVPRKYEIFDQILLSESTILFENIKKKYLKT